jgi:hypothetical protein
VVWNRRWLEDSKPTVRAFVLIHEELHQVRGIPGYDGWSQKERAVEEAAVESVTLDLAPRWLRQHSDWSTAPSMYLAESIYRARVLWLRQVSAHATASNWTSVRARSWRVSLLKGDDPTRAEMLAPYPAAPTTGIPDS